MTTASYYAVPIVFDFKFRDTNSRTEFSSGSSLAAAYVSGIAALLLER